MTQNAVAYPCGNGASGKVEVCTLSNNLCVIYRRNFYES